MTHINAVIVDDEERGIIALKQMIMKYCIGLNIVGEATNVTDAKEIIGQTNPDVVFLDIEMPGGNGFQLLEQLDTVSFDTIFVTAYQEYALKAIKFSAFDYLLKPVKSAELQGIVERVVSKKIKHSASQYELLKNAFGQARPLLTRIILSTTEGYYPVKLDDIIYCKADDSYTHFYLRNNKHYIVSKNLREYADLFSGHNFFRVHKSFMVNLDQVESIKKADGVTIVMSNSHEIPLSLRKKEEFLQKMKGI